MRPRCGPMPNYLGRYMLTVRWLAGARNRSMQRRGAGAGACACACRPTAGLLLHQLGAVSSVARPLPAAQHPAASLHAPRLRVRVHDRQPPVGVRVERRDRALDARNVRMTASRDPLNCVFHESTDNTAEKYSSGVFAALAAEPIGPGGPRPAHFLALVGHPYLWWPAHFFG